MAVGDAHVFPGFLTPVLTQLSFQSHRLPFSHASAEVRGENTPERKFASTGDRTRNHKVRSPTRSPLSHPGGKTKLLNDDRRYSCDEIAHELDISYESVHRILTERLQMRKIAAR